MLSDVCKHCERAGCLEACPTGAIIRTEFGSVYVQPDVCNGCGYCVVGLSRSASSTGGGRRPRLEVHPLLRPPARATWSRPAPRPARPIRSSSATSTSCASGRAGASSSFATRGVARGVPLRRGRGDQPGTEGLHAFFLLVRRPEVYNLPPDPVVPTAKSGKSWWAMAAGVLSLALALGSAVSGRRA